MFSETSILVSATRRNIPEDDILHIHRRENLKSCIYINAFTVNRLNTESIPMYHYYFQFSIAYMLYVTNAENKCFAQFLLRSKNWVSCMWECKYMCEKAVILSFKILIITGCLHAAKTFFASCVGC
jgi:hypothetical protein